MKLTSIAQDCWYGLRSLRKQPAFAVLASLTLALGIGATTTIFSVIQNVLISPFPYATADKIFMFQIRDPASPRRGDRWWFQVPEFLEYQTQVAAFEEVIAVETGHDVLYSTREGTEHFNGALVSGNAFRFLGVAAAVGRVLNPDDVQPGATPVFVMSHRMWTERFGRDPAIVGRAFVLNGVPTTLVGITSPRFAMAAADLWEPVVLDRTNSQGSERAYNLYARLKPGVTVQQGEAEFRVVADRLHRSYPQLFPKTFTVKGLSLLDSVVERFGKTLYTFAGAVGILLLIACGNVANMLLARAAARRKEMAIRASLGASRGRLVRQLLIESVMLAMLGAGAGLLFAYFGLRALVTAIPDGLIPPEAVIAMNVPVLLFSLCTAVLTALVFGLVPALQTAGDNVVEPLKNSGQNADGLRHGGLSASLVVVEVALSLMMLASAGLLMRSFVNLQAIDLGLNPQNVLYVRLRLPPDKYGTPAAKQQLIDQLLQRLQALPGVVEAAAASAVPLNGGIKSGIDMVGRPHEATLSTLVQLCSEGYFRTLELRLLRGRVLSTDDVETGRKVAVVNETLARLYFGREDPIGRQMKLNALQTLPGNALDNPTFEIVGVVIDAKNHGIQNPSWPESFIPSSVTWAYGRSLVVRTAGPPLRVVNSIRSAVWAADRNLVVTQTETLKNFLRQSYYTEPRLSLVVLGVFASLGLALVALGVYGVVAYAVSRRTHEIGIRMALGAGRGDVQRMVLGMGLRQIGLGVIVGILTSLGATGVLASQLWGVTPHDPLTLGAVAVVVVTAGASACYFPARHATRVDPMEALRIE